MATDDPAAAGFPAPAAAGSTLKTLQLVFGSGALPASVVKQVYDEEGQDMKLCTQVLWDLTPQVKRELNKGHLGVGTGDSTHNTHIDVMIAMQYFNRKALSSQRDRVIC